MKEGLTRQWGKEKKDKQNGRQNTGYVRRTLKIEEHEHNKKRKWTQTARINSFCTFSDTRHVTLTHVKNPTISHKKDCDDTLTQYLCIVRNIKLCERWHSESKGLGGEQVLLPINLYWLVEGDMLATIWSDLSFLILGLKHIADPLISESLDPPLAYVPFCRNHAVVLRCNMTI